MRAEKLCGWVDPSTWHRSIYEGSPFDIDGAPYLPTICPGWLMRQPLIVEVAAAWRCFEKGNFGDFYPDASHVLCDGVLMLDAAIAAHQKRERETKQ